MSPVINFINLAIHESASTFIHLFTPVVWPGRPSNHSLISISCFAGVINPSWGYFCISFNIIASARMGICLDSFRADSYVKKIKVSIMESSTDEACSTRKQYPEWQTTLRNRIFSNNSR